CMGLEGPKHTLRVVDLLGGKRPEGHVPSGFPAFVTGGRTFALDPGPEASHATLERVDPWQETRTPTGTHLPVREGLDAFVVDEGTAGIVAWDIAANSRAAWKER